VDLGLAGKRALVTGASRGLGRAVVERLVAEGMQVGICARGAEGVALAVKELGPNGEVIGSPVDASDHAALAAWVEEFGERLGGVDVLISNAGPGEEPQVLTQQLDSVQLLDPENLRYNPSFMVRGLQDLPVRIRRRHAED
jgi:NAD(P)-dependent dehydrogenase (short-subunit alcohol dehydrogenase family)